MVDNQIFTTPLHLPLEPFKVIVEPFVGRVVSGDVPEVRSLRLEKTSEPPKFPYPLIHKSSHRRVYKGRVHRSRVRKTWIREISRLLCIHDP